MTDMAGKRALHVDRESWLEALRIKGSPDEALLQQMDEAESLLLEEAMPRTVYRIMERDAVQTVGFSIEKHLEGCEKVVLLGATLGIGVDNLLRRVQVTDMARVVLLDSGASVLIQQVCDGLEEGIRERLTREGTAYLTSRFSPGYGDYPITEQAQIVRLLDGQRRIGLTVTASSLMIPRKSITALMGIADHLVTGRLAGCRECVLKEKCNLRKEGKFCGDRF